MSAEIQLIERQEKRGQTVAPTESGSLLTLISRAASDPSVDLDKMERLMAMHERIVARNAETAFNEAMSLAQSEMGRVSADATNPQTHSRYASYAKLDAVLRPIYSHHGFSLSFDEADSPKPEHVRVVCHVSHKGGHTRTYHKDMPADGKGAKGGDVMTKTHATGAAQSYGMRYLLKGIFNVAVGEDDRDGNTDKRQEEANKPAGYDKWAADMEACADSGTAALQDAWKKSPGAFRTFATAGGDWWARVKAKAAQVKS